MTVEMAMLEPRETEELQRPRDPDPALLERYRLAFIDWAACAVAGVSGRGRRRRRPDSGR
jgi:hypothetical protein